MLHVLQVLSAREKDAKQQISISFWGGYSSEVERLTADQNVVGLNNPTVPRVHCFGHKCLLNERLITDSIIGRLDWKP